MVHITWWWTGILWVVSYHITPGCVKESSFYTPSCLREWAEPDSIETSWMLFPFCFMFFCSCQPSLFTLLRNLEKKLQLENIWKFLNLQILLTLESVVILPRTDKCRCWTMSKILSREWIVSHRNEMWLLILVAHLFQRNVNSGHMPTKAVDPEAFMNVVSWDFPYLGGNKVPYMLLFVSVYYLHYILYLYVVVISASRT